MLVEGVTDYAIYMLDPQGLVSNWNAGAQRAKGYVANEVIGRHFSMFYEPADRQAGLPEQGLLTARIEGTFQSEGWRVRKDGSRFWAHVVIQPIHDDNGRLFGYAKITRDRTEKRSAALALEATTRNLDLALDNMLQGLCLFDRFGRLVLCNEQFTRLLAMPADAARPGTRFPTLLRLLCRLANPALGDEVRTARAFRRSLTNTASMVATVAQATDASPASAREAEPAQEQHSTEFSYQGRQIAVTTRRLSHGGWVSTLEDVTVRRESERRIEYLAHYDSLTGLPNRVTFQKTLQDVLGHPERTSRLALLYLDLDRFKAVNDSLGHHIGDQLLKAVARRLSLLLDPGDQLARLSGDEFTLIMRHCRHLADAISLADRAIRALTRPFELAGNHVTVGVSIGVVHRPDVHSSVSDVLQQADLALYKAKREGRNCYRVYEPGMNDPLRLRNELEVGLRRALQRGEFYLNYQPIVEAGSGELTSCEALLRWAHPTRGLIAPSDFIPIAEERGLMPEVGAWVLERACADAAKWPSHIRLSVNVSAAQLIDEEFASVLARALRQSGLRADRLELEVTESTLLETSETPRRTLNAIRALGVGVAMDDFGTGYSSMSLLQNFPFTRIKIDRSFVRHLGDNHRSSAIVRSIIGLCQSLGIPVIAEGVETDTQRALLVAEQCGELQGYLFGKPMALEALEDWMQAA